ncbi:amidohydrolase family protein [Waltera sp.]|uniref:amidohydrolase family protein n=1 Tax=Waltera sp. TaxID=2815806 RepID=UPI003AA9A318
MPLRVFYYTATCRGAEMAGIGDITGTLESGKCADMIVVEKNPLEDLRVLRNVDMVIAQGKVIRAPKVKKKQIVQTELGTFLN